MEACVGGGVEFTGCGREKSPRPEPRKPRAPRGAPRPPLENDADARGAPAPLPAQAPPLPPPLPIPLPLGAEAAAGSDTERRAPPPRPPALFEAFRFSCASLKASSTFLLACPTTLNSAAASFTATALSFRLAPFTPGAPGNAFAAPLFLSASLARQSLSSALLRSSSSALLLSSSALNSITACLSRSAAAACSSCSWA